MSDYLGNLVARSLEMVETLRPRHQPMFGGPESRRRPDMDQTVGEAGDELRPSPPAIDLPPAPAQQDLPGVSPVTAADPTPTAERGDPEQPQELSASPSPDSRPLDEGQLVPRRDEPQTEHRESPEQPARPLVSPVSEAPQSGEEQTAGPRHQASDERGPGVAGRSPQHEEERAAPLQPRMAAPAVGAAASEEKTRQGDRGEPQSPSGETPDDKPPIVAEPAPSPRISGAVKPPYVGSQTYEVASEQAVTPSAQSPAGAQHQEVAHAPLWRLPLERAAKPEGDVLPEEEVPRRRSAQEVPARVTAQPYVRQRVEPMATFPARSDTPTDSTPEVHVTIGRIEVRAEPPSAPEARKSRPRPPITSLNEYLASRSGGGGR